MVHEIRGPFASGAATMAEGETEYVGTRTIGKRIGASEDQVKRQLKAGLLPAIKRGKSWTMTESAYREYRRRQDDLAVQRAITALQ